MTENRRQVLDMLAQGNITVEEAERLLSLVDQPTGSDSGGTETREARKQPPKYLRVVIGDGDDSQSEHVNIRVPMGLIRAGVKLASVLPNDATSKVNQKLREKGIDVDLGNLKADDLGNLVDSLADLQADISDGNEKVRIYVE